jgi:hypothetical protein
MDITAYPFLNVVLSLFLLFIWAAWIFIWIRITFDVLRRGDFSGWYKAIWIVLLIFIPGISAIVYIVAYNRDMADRESSGGGRWRPA